ncbi:MAG: 3-deoxy-8-phosphooctulonate synthase, partial [Betaproteobacteria bacterium]|nr:3-deoxy-8-phosphooctulonate synthase [Betaproteobacteria bacterium]
MNEDATEAAVWSLCGRRVGLSYPFFLIAGPCVIESLSMVMHCAERLKSMTASLGIHFVFKSSFDKANRSSAKSFRGPGIDEGLRILERVRQELDLPVLTDVHEASQIEAV